MVTTVLEMVIIIIILLAGINFNVHHSSMVKTLMLHIDRINIIALV